MVESLIGLFVYLLVAGLLYWAATTILALVPLPEPIRTVLNVVLVVIICLIVIYALLGLLPGGYRPLLR